MDIFKKFNLHTIFNKSVSIMVCLVMILSVFSTCIVVNAANPDVWDGSKAQGFAEFKGNGTVDSPYEIENGAQLAYVVSTDLTDGLYYKLVKDIRLNDTSNANWKESARNWVWGDVRFVGNFDGDGHTIDGLYFKGSQKRFGLFSYIGDSVIANIRFTNAYVENTTSEEGQAIVAAQASAKADFDRIYIDASCEINAPNVKGVAGIIARSDKNVNITNSAVFGKYVGKSHVGAFFGTFWGGTQTIKNCFTACDVPVIASRTPTVENTYAIVKEPGEWFDRNVTFITADQMKGEAAKTNMPGLDFDNVWQVVENDYPMLITMIKEEETEGIEIWGGKPADTAAIQYADGDGSKGNPYQIENGDQLYKMVAENSANANGAASTEAYKYYKIIKDIYLNDVKAEDLVNPSTTAWDAKGFNAWLSDTTQSSGFCGEVDGGGFTVYGLYCNGGTYSGLITSTVGAKVYNLNIKNAYIKGRGGAGGIIGQTYGADTEVSVSKCMVDNVYIDGGDKVRIGGIVGGCEGSTKKVAISDCSVTNAVIITSHATYVNIQSGILGYTGEQSKNHTVTNCFTDDTVFPVTDTTNTTHFNKFTNYITYSNVYTLKTNTNTANGVTVLTADKMKGEAAKTNMPGLDFDTVWETVENGYPVINVRESSVTPPPVNDKFWDGTAAESFAGGLGTAESPFLIENASQLFKMVKEYTAVSNDSAFATPTYFKLQNDIHINDVKDEDMVAPTVDSWNAKGFKAWDPGYLYKESTGFCGVIDGAGYTVYGLYCKEGTYGGLLPNVADSVVVKNLNVKNSYVRIGGNGGPGVIIGVVNGKANNRTTATVSYCTVDNCYVASEGTGSWRCGAIVGGGNGEGKITVNDCAVTRVRMTVANTQTPGRSCAFIGNTNTYSGHEVINCYTDASTHPVTNSTTKDLYDVIHGNKVYTNIYTSAAKPACDTYSDITYLSDAQMKGEAAKTNMSGLDFNYVWKTVDGAYPAIYLREKPAKPPRPDFVWDGTKATEFAGGKGTAAEPYLVSNGAQLYKMIMDFTATYNDGVIEAPTYFKITNDIYLNDVKEADLVNPTTLAWDEAGHISWHSELYNSRAKGFCGDVDGGGHTIYGLYYREGNFAGLIPVAADSTNVYNLNVKNSFIRANGNPTGAAAGGIIGLVSGAGNNRSTANVTYCKVNNSAIVADHNQIWRINAVVGGGYNEGKVVVSNCGVTNMQMTTINPSTVNRTGAFIGSTTYTNHEVTNCYSDSSVHPVSDTVDKTQYDTIHERHTYTNVYTSAAKPACDTYGDITYLTEAQMKGDNAKKNFVGFDFENDWAVVANDYPSIKENAGIWMYDTKLPGEAWSGKLARYFAGGNGSKDDPYQINTAGQLALLAQDALNGKTAGKYYVITADIIVNDTTKANWKDTAHEWFTGYWDQAFYGNLNGGYHTISGLYLNKTRANYTGTHYYSGLFAAIGEGAVIEKLGIVNSSMTFTTSDAKIGAFAGFVRQYNADKVGSENYPVIRECFADTSVYLEGTSCGGFIGTATRPIYIEDSFFTGKVAGTAYGLFGYSKMNKTYDEVFVKNCYVADAKYAIVSNVSYESFKYENVYSSSAQDTNGIIRLFIDKMTGAAAKENMTALDFKNIWVVGADLHTPGLKGFAKDAYNNYMKPFDIVVNFETNCDLIVEPKVGKAYSKLELPALQREGYVFAGWYAYPELDVPFTYDYFPTFDTILYAKWVLSGFAQDFEAYEDSVYDYHEDYEYYRPTSSNYTAKYVHGGAKSMHRLGNSNEDLDFLLMYADELVVGRKYTITFYTTTDQAKASVNTSLVHLDWPDVYSADNGVEKMASITNLTDGEWVETTYTFVARSKWIAIRTSGNNSVYFDDFLLYDVGQGTIVDISKPENDANNNENIEVEPDDNENDKPVEQKPDNKVDTDDTTEKSTNVVLIVAIVAGSLLALGVIAFVIILIVKRKKK